MWNEDKSLRLSRVCIWVFFCLVIVICVGTPWLLTALGDTTMVGGVRVQDAFWMLLAVEYTASVVACAALYKLHKLLANIENERVFVEENVTVLRALSWHCIAAGVVFAVGAALCWPLLWLVAAVSAFAGLILRVMKNVFAEAVRLKDENDFTI